MANKSKFKTKLQKYLGQPLLDVTTINDIEEKYFNSEPLDKKEMVALQNFQRYRVRKLSDSKNQSKFDKNFARLQVLSNIAPYTEFLKERYALKV